jgi:hypothetical protein
MRKVIVLLLVFVLASTTGAIEVLAQDAAGPVGFQVLKENFIEGG